MEKCKYTVSPVTGLFADALNAYEITKNAYLTALTALYGEDKGGEMYNNDFDVLEAVNARILSGLNASILDNIGHVNRTEI